MGKYLLKRLLKGALSIVAVVFVVLILVFTLMNRELIFDGDSNLIKLSANAKTEYKMRKYEKYGYIDYVTFNDYLTELLNDGEFESEEEKGKVATLGKTPTADSQETKIYAAKFTETYTELGYEVTRLTVGSTSDKPFLFATKEINVFQRLFKYFKNLIKIDTVNYATGIEDSERKITFTWNDPAYGGDKFAPAIMGNGTKHKYLLYFDDQFPFIHQNLITISLGTSYAVNDRYDVWETMTLPQGSGDKREVIWPTGYVSESNNNIHTLTYIEGSGGPDSLYAEYFVDDYTNCETYGSNQSQMFYSFIIGIIAVCLSYFIGIPLGLLMARYKEKFFDKLGTCYIVFIIAVPSLAYIFMFQRIGSHLFHLPSEFKIGDGKTILMYILPIVSLALPSIAGLMKWTRRYMIDQYNSDYVRFARSNGLSDGQIFSKHILKNAIIPITQGIPGAILGALTGAIITESVYKVPGVGRVLTTAISAYDNNVIVGVTVFFAVLSVIALILGDLLMATVDPRISFNTKER